MYVVCDQDVRVLSEGVCRAGCWRIAGEGEDRGVWGWHGGKLWK